MAPAAYAVFTAVFLSWIGCGVSDIPGPYDDTGFDDAEVTDSGTTDDAGVKPDAGSTDAGPTDGGIKPDSGTPDSGTADGGIKADAGIPDAGHVDGGIPVPDAGVASSFDKDIKPIMQSKCTGCHSSAATYTWAKTRADNGNLRSKANSKHHMTAAEAAAIIKWIDEGAQP